MKKLGFGLMRLPTLDARDPSSVDLSGVIPLVDRYLHEGFSYFDTAYYYHGEKSEETFRAAVAERWPRERYTITDKLPIYEKPAEQALLPMFERQLARCGVEYFDYYLLHNVGGKNYAHAEAVHAFDFLRRRKDEGRARHIGMSYHDNAELLETILKRHPEIEVVQLQLNYLDWDDLTIQSRRCYDVCTRYHKPVIVMEPVKGGSLAALQEDAAQLLRAYAPDASFASWAIRFAASLENVMVVLSGMSDLAQVADNTAYMRELRVLNGQEHRILEQAAALLRGSNTIGCTGCHYCTDGCPMQIPIPEIFRLYNNYVKFPGTQDHVALNYYGNVTSGRGSADCCIGCGQCEEHCPQHLAIPGLLADVHATLQKLQNA